MPKPRFKICPACQNQGNVPVPECGNTRPHGRHHYQVPLESKGRFRANRTEAYVCEGKDGPAKCKTCNGAGIVPND